MLGIRHSTRLTAVPRIWDEKTVTRISAFLLGREAGMRRQPPDEPVKSKLTVWLVGEACGQPQLVAPPESLLPSGVVYVGRPLEAVGASTSFYMEPAV